MSRLPLAALLIALALPGAALGSAPVAVDVRMMSAQEVAERYDMDQVRLGLAAGVFVAPAGLLMASAGGGESAAMLGPPSTMQFQSLVAPVREALLGTDFAEMVWRALRERIAALPETALPAQTLSVALAWSGLQAAEGRPTMMEADDDFCVAAAGAATVIRDGAALPEQAVNRGVHVLSPGMSRPACASFSSYAERGGLAVRRDLGAAAAALADWLMDNALAR